MNALKKEFPVESLPNFIQARGNFSAENATFIQTFADFHVLIVKCVVIPDSTCSKTVDISWGDMVEKTDHCAEWRYQDLNKSRESLYTLSCILNDKKWENLYSIIGTTLMNFVLSSAILLRASPVDEIYFIINRDYRSYCQELNKSVILSKHVSDIKPGTNGIAEERNLPLSKPESSPDIRLKTIPVPLKSKSNGNSEVTATSSKKNCDDSFLSLYPTLYSNSNNIFWPKNCLLFSVTASQFLNEVMNFKDCQNAELLQITAKLQDLKMLVSNVLFLHRSGLPEKILRSFKIFSKKKSASEIRIAKRRRKIAKLKPFSSKEAGETFLRKKLRGLRHTSKRKLLSVLAKLIRKVYYSLLCGSKANFVLFKKRLGRFLNFGKGQSVSVEYFIAGFRLGDVKWLQNFLSAATKKLLFSRVFAWFFKHGILKFLKVNFYVTETAKSKNGLLFFDKFTWSSMRQIYATHLVKSQKFQQISKAKARMRLQHLAVKTIGRFRFIPKPKGMRPLITLRYSVEEKKKLIRYKIVLQQLLHNVHYSSQRTDILDCLNDYFKKIKTSKKDLFFVKVDIYDAYGSILQDKLISIIKKGLESINMRKKLFLYEVYTVYFNRALNKFTYKKRYSINLNRVKAPKNSINVFSNSPTVSIDVPFMLRFLEDFVKNQIFREGRHLLHQVNGVPQSNLLSAVFSELYYNDLTGEHLRCFVDEENLLYRFSDDFILITPNQKDAEEFHGKALSGFPDYNCSISKQKIETNLTESARCVSKLHFFGFNIDICSSTVTVDYSSFNKLNTFSSIALPHEERRLSKVVEYHFRDLRICAYSFWKLTLAYSFNSLNTTRVNFFEAALMVATKFRILVDTIFSNKSNTRYLVQVLLKIVGHFENHNEELRKFRRFTLSQDFVKVTVIAAFIEHLNQYPSWYEVCLEMDGLRKTVYNALPSKERKFLK